MEKIVLQSIQSSVLQDIDEVKPLDDTDFDVLREIGQVLRRHGRTDRFGVCLLHKHFDLAPDEELFEETDVKMRVSTVSVRTAGASDQRTIETLWRFSEDVTAITRCVARCNYNLGHKRVHVKEGV